MTIVSIKIPQLGEGLQEARLVEFLKQPGDRVERDECIYVMETDKAISEIEATESGTLVEWTVEPNSVVPIGAEVGKLAVSADDVGADDVGADDVGATTIDTPVSDTDVAGRNGLQSDHGHRVEADRSVPVEFVGTAAMWASALIPPRTRRYLKEKQLLRIADQIPATGTKLMPADVDRYLETKPISRTKDLATSSNDSAKSTSFIESEVPSAQQTLIFRMARGTQVVLPAVLETEIDWAPIAAARRLTKPSGGPTSFAMFLWCVVEAMKKHPMLRSSMSADSKMLRTYHDVNLGVAVALEADQLRTAVVRQADSLAQAEFFAKLTAQIEQAREGKDQIDASTTVTVSNVGIAGMRSGIPLVVTPAVATLALGEVRDKPVPSSDGSIGFTFRKVATLTMSFDHRLLNGMGAAKFLNDVRELAATFSILESEHEW